MTEDEWIHGTDPYELLGSITKQRSFSERKIRLFAVACCHRVLHLLPEPETQWQCRAAFERAAERAESPAAEVARDPDHLVAALAESCGGFAAAALSLVHTDPTEAQAYAAHAVYASSGLTGTGYADSPAMVWSVAADAGAAIDGITDDLEPLVQAEIVRDIFGPYQLVIFKTPSNPPDIVAIAQAIYDDQTFDQLPKLALALEKTGIDHPDILNHCRQRKIHVRGCWVVDLVLGKG